MKTLAPIAVGGLGGSGTRVVAELLQSAGVYIGATLNPALDNLWFTLLYKRERWYVEPPSAAELARTTDLFGRAMTDGLEGALSRSDRSLIRVAIRERGRRASPIGSWADVANGLMSSRELDREKYSGWGWKEPNTHIFLPDLHRSFPRMRYVHVIRNGLDMALSSNRNQLENWGARFDVTEKTHPDPVERSLEYWIRANARAMAFGADTLGEHFHLLNYDELCSAPGKVVSEFFAFIGFEPNEATLAESIALIDPKSVGRYAREGSVAFTERQRERVRAFGFTLD